MTEESTPEELTPYKIPINQLPRMAEMKESIERFANTFNIEPFLQTAGQIELTEAQKEILFAQVKEEDVEVRPDGLVYLPWMEYAHRLSQAFGMAWALIPNGMPKAHSNFIYWGFWLIIQGHLAGYAIGEQQYFPQSKSGGDFMTYGDACEGAKSNALMRLCKGVGISLELWKPSFVREWKLKHAETYKDARDRTRWRKIGSTVIADDPEPPPPEPKSKTKVETKATALLTAETLSELKAALVTAGYTTEDARKVKIHQVTGKMVKELTTEDCRLVLQALLEEEDSHNMAQEI